MTGTYQRELVTSWGSKCISIHYPYHLGRSEPIRAKVAKGEASYNHSYSIGARGGLCQDRSVSVQSKRAWENYLQYITS